MSRSSVSVSLSRNEGGVTSKGKTLSINHPLRYRMKQHPSPTSPFHLKLKSPSPLPNNIRTNQQCLPFIPGGGGASFLHLRGLHRHEVALLLQLITKRQDQDGSILVVQQQPESEPDE